MEVQFPPDVQAKLEQMARDVGRRSDELVQDAVIGLFDELTFAREMLERRYATWRRDAYSPSTAKRLTAG